MNANTQEAGEQRMLALITYVLHLVGSVTALPSLIALVINFVRRDAQPPYAAHHRWMLRTFVWTIIWFILAGVLVGLIITAPLGWLLIGIAWVWWVYRHVRGLIVLLNDGELPA